MPKLPDPPDPPTRPATLVELTRDECFVLLRTVEIGRVAVSRGDRAPLVVPVNFAVDGEAVVFRTNAGTKLDAVATGPIAFEAPILASISWPALALTAAAALAIFRFRAGPLPILAGCALAGVGYGFFSGTIPA